MDPLSFEKALYRQLAPGRVCTNEDMSGHTSFKAGGRTRYLLKPVGVEQLKAVLMLCKEFDVHYKVMGKGTNLLVRDEGYEGAVIQILEGFSEVEVLQNDKIRAGAGAMLSAIAAAAQKSGLSGFEFASGIPGALGGAVFMNAGAYDGEIKDVFIKAVAINAEGKEVTLSKADMDFGYRSSRAQKELFIITEAVLAFSKGDRSEIREKMLDFNKRRKDKQPLEYPSAGSTFKRPEGHFAGKLIMDSGLAGFRIGGAAVSEKHCGFIINIGGATATDIIKLMEHVQNKVYEKFGVFLTPEVEII